MFEHGFFQNVQVQYYMYSNKMTKDKNLYQPLVSLPSPNHSSFGYTMECRMY